MFESEIYKVWTKRYLGGGAGCWREEGSDLGKSVKRVVRRALKMRPMMRSRMKTVDW